MRAKRKVRRRTGIIVAPRLFAKLVSETARWLGDAEMVGAACEQSGAFTAQMKHPPRSGKITYINVPAGFSWQIEPAGGITIRPGWWRQIVHRLTGRWSVP